MYRIHLNKRPIGWVVGKQKAFQLTIGDIGRGGNLALAEPLKKGANVTVGGEAHAPDSKQEEIDL